jgi:ABC-type phosphate transport system substrate-binding protein
MMTKKITGLLLALALCAPAAAGELVLIVSARGPAMTLRADQAADIFLAQTGRFPNGADVVPLDLPVGSPLRDQFYQKVAAKSAPLMRAYWSKMVFTGRGQPPREVATGQALRKMVAANPSYIGYIDSALLDDSVQVVLVVGK